MIESAGAYGIWFERRRFEPQPTRIQLLTLNDQDLVDKNAKLYVQRFAYRKECQRLLNGLSVMNYAMEGRIAIRVNTPSLGDGLILREVFEEQEDFKNKPVRTAFLITSQAIFKIRNLTPQALAKAEKAELDFRLSRLKLVSNKIEIRDIFLDDKREDAELLERIIRQSIEVAKKKVGQQQYAANLASLN